MPLNQPAALDPLLLIGVVVNNGMVMIEHINMYRPPLAGGYVQGAKVFLFDLS